MRNITRAFYLVHAALRGYSAAISPGTIFNFGLVFPTLSPGTAYLTNVVARTAAGGFPDKFTLQVGGVCML